MYLRSKGAQGERELNPLKRVGACNSASGLVGVPLNVVYIENGKSLYESGAVESGSLNARINMCGGPIKASKLDLRSRPHMILVVWLSLGSTPLRM